MRKKASQSYRIGRIYLRILPIVVWLGAVLCVVALFRRRAERFEVVGMAQGQVRQIAATCTGRLSGVTVELYQRVSEGQILAIIDTILDNEHLQAELATASAEMERLQAQLDSTRDQLLAEAVNLENDRVANKRRFDVDVENARLRVAQLTATLETDRIMLQGLELDIKRFLIQRRFDANDVVLLELKRMGVDRDTLAKRIEENQRQLAQAEQDFEQARQRRDDYAQRQIQHASVDKALDVIREAIKVQDNRVRELLARRQPLQLKSPFGGVVSQVLCRPGEAVLPGVPILTIADDEPNDIVAYANEEQIGLVQEATQVVLIKETEPQQIAYSEVTYIGPTVEQMPVRLWRNPNLPQWGRPILIKIPEGFELISGQLVGIRGL